MLQKNEDEENLLKERGCCMRIICLICCCVTKDLGSQSQLNGLKQEEIELYRQQIEEEMKKRQSLKKPDGNTSVS